MSLREENDSWYGDNAEDNQAFILLFSTDNGNPADHFAASVCKTCGHSAFKILLDEEEGCAKRVCASCNSEHFIGDSAEFAEDATLEECECPCGKDLFQAVVGVHLYRESEDVKWLYLGLRCTACSMTAAYGD